MYNCMEPNVNNFKIEFFLENGFDFISINEIYHSKHKILITYFDDLEKIRKKITFIKKINDDKTYRHVLHSYEDFPSLVEYDISGNLLKVSYSLNGLFHSVAGLPNQSCNKKKDICIKRFWRHGNAKVARKEIEKIKSFLYIPESSSDLTKVKELFKITLNHGADSLIDLLQSLNIEDINKVDKEIIELLKMNY